MGQLIRTGFSSSTKMNFFAILVFAGIVACVFCEEAKKEDVQKAAKKEDLKSDMKTKLKNLAMKSKRTKKTGMTKRGMAWGRSGKRPKTMTIMMRKWRRRRATMTKKKRRTMKKRRWMTRKRRKKG